MTDKALQALELGHKGESYIFALFERAGRNPIPAPRGRGDIVLDGGEGLSIEVKASTLTRSGDGRRRYQFCLYRQMGQVVKTDARRSDILILLAYADLDKNPVLFCIPTRRLNGTKTLKLPTNLNAYAGWVSHYRNFNRALDELGQGVEL